MSRHERAAQKARYPRETPSAAASYDPPLPPQKPFGESQRDYKEENDRHVPKLFRFAHRNSRCGIRNIRWQFRQVLRLPIFSAGLRGKLLEQFAILFGVKVFGHTIKPLKGNSVAAKFLPGALRGHFSHI